MSAKFHSRRNRVKGDMLVQTGFRNNELTFRLHFPSNNPVSLTYQQASDLSDVLDDMLDLQDEDPLL